MSDYLPEELMIEIILRLPMDSVVRFRCVSKPWYSLISSPNFIHTYLNRTILDSDANNTHCLLVRQLDFGLYIQKERYTLHLDNESLGLVYDKLDFPFKGFNEVFRIVGSCNGLVCLSDDLYSIMNTVILWNPIINKSLQLPLPSITNYWPHGPSSHVFGFGFDPNSTDYKVLKLTYFKEGTENFRLKTPPLVELYSLRLGSWSGIRGRAPLRLVHYNSSQAFVDGTINWVAVDQNRSHALILSFDLTDEEFGEMNLPETLVKENPMTLSISEFGKSIVVFHHPNDCRKCNVWVMEEYGMVESWTKLFTIDMAGMEKVLFLRRNGDVISYSINEVITYNPKNQLFSRLGLHGTLFCAHAFMPSLVLLGEGNEILVGQAESPDAMTSDSED